MRILPRRSLFLLLLFGFLLTPLSAFAQFDVWPTAVYHPPGEPSCLTFTASGAAYATVDFEVYYPSGGPYYWYGIQLDGNGQVLGCIDAGWEVGAYSVTAVNYLGNWYPVSASFNVYTAPIPPPEIYAAGSGCDNWDCVWAVGIRFHDDSRVEVYTTDWAHSEVHYGSAWQMQPPLWVVDPDWLGFPLVDPDVRTSFGWNGVYFRVVNNDGTSTPWTWVGVPAPTITSGVPTCSDFYCVQLDGVFPLNTVVPITLPNDWEWLPDPYTDLVVTATQITLRFNPGVRHVYDTIGLWAFAVNPAIFNWSSPYYLSPVDRAVIGHVDAIVGTAPNYSLTGWACAKTYAQSIEVHVYVVAPYGGSGSIFAFSGVANVASEPAIATLCNSTGTNYRFSLPIPASVLQNYADQPLYVYGISPFGPPHPLLTGGSGSFTVPGPAPTSLKEYIYLGGRVIAVESQ